MEPVSIRFSRRMRDGSYERLAACFRDLRKRRVWKRRTQQSWSPSFRRMGKGFQWMDEQRTRVYASTKYRTGARIHKNLARLLRRMDDRHPAGRLYRARVKAGGGR